MTARIADGSTAALAARVFTEGLRRASPAASIRYAPRSVGFGLESSPCPLALSALGTVLVADRIPETKSRTGNYLVYQRSTRSRRKPRHSMRLSGDNTASERDGMDREGLDEHRSPHPDRFLNHVRRSDSCRGHLAQRVANGMRSDGPRGEVARFLPQRVLLCRLCARSKEEGAGDDRGEGDDANRAHPARG